jgi:hypothetical protein
MNKQNRKYLLFIFSDFRENGSFLKDIPLQFIPISTSKYFKYNFGDYGMVCNFETDLPFDEIRDFTQMVLEGLVDQFFIIEHSDNMAAYMPDNLKLNLFDLDSDNRKYNTPDNMSDKQGEDEGFKIMELFLKKGEDGSIDPSDFINFIFSGDEDDEDDEDPIIYKARMRQKAKDARPSLDQLLEKIKEKGIKSLTKYENQLLEEYARN